jgi:cytochrome b561
MSIPPRPGGDWRYAPPAVILHWLLAVLIAGMLTVGLYMTSIEDDPESDFWFALHKSFGLVVFTLVLLRMAWRLTHRPAELPASLPHWEVLASTIVQWLLYLCMLLMPLTGFVGASYTKTGIAFFGLPLARWRDPDRAMSELFFEVHETLAWILLGLVAVHALGGLKHLLVDRDRVFQRMWF